MLLQKKEQKGEMEMPHKKIHRSDPRYTNNQHCFGEIVIIKSIKNTKIKQKIKDICDNAGENKILEKNVSKKKWEYSLSIQPQEHHIKIQSWKGFCQPCSEKSGQ